MRRSRIRWGTVLGLAALAEVLLVASAVLYMVSITAGTPIFFLLARWLARRGNTHVIVGDAVAFWVVWAMIDNTILVATEGFGGRQSPN